MTKVTRKTKSPQFQGRDVVAVVVEALGVLKTREGIVVSPALIEERARNIATALQGEFAIAKIGPIGLGQALAHLDAASAILVALEGRL
jgi:hypothetical protein